MSVLSDMIREDETSFEYDSLIGFGGHAEVHKVYITRPRSRHKSSLTYE
jgi:hypothetical protein